ncbi:MAG: hypothetical protein RIT32_1102 [Actinomycetota bacterium]|jgi:hypothetical protein
MSQSDPAVSPRDLIAPAAITGIWATSFGVVMAALPVLVIWTLGASGAGSLAAAIKAAFLAWPISHGVPVLITTVTIDVLPLLTIIFPVFMLRRAAMRMFRVSTATFGQISAVALPIILVNSAISFVIAWLASDDVIGIAPLTTAFLVAVVSLVAVSLGALKVFGWPSVELPISIKFGFRVGLLIITILLVAALVLAAVMLILNFSNALNVVDSIADTSTEKFLVWLFTFGYFPIAISWGYAWLLGPGVATGIDTAASFAVVDQSALPALPWLAALPTTTVTYGWYLLLFPLLISVFFALLMWWSLHHESYRVLITNTIMALTIVVAVTVLVSLIGGGAIGPGRLSVFGPQWLPMIGGVFVTIAPAFVLLLIVDAIRRWIKNRNAKQRNA